MYCIRFLNNSFSSNHTHTYIYKLKTGKNNRIYIYDMSKYEYMMICGVRKERKCLLLIYTYGFVLTTV